MRKRMSVSACAQRTFSLRIHRATDGMRTMRSIVRMPARYEPGHTQCASKGEALCENKKDYPCAILAQKDSLSCFHKSEKEGFEAPVPFGNPHRKEVCGLCHFFRTTSAPAKKWCRPCALLAAGRHLVYMYSDLSDIIHPSNPWIPDFSFQHRKGQK